MQISLYSCKFCVGIKNCQVVKELSGLYGQGLGLESSTYKARISLDSTLSILIKVLVYVPGNENDEVVNKVVN